MKSNLMRTLLKLLAVGNLLILASGCVIEHRTFVRAPFPPRAPIPTPPVVVVEPPRPPAPEVVIVEPPRRPQPPVVVVEPPRIPRPEVIVVEPPRIPTPPVVIVEPRHVPEPPVVVVKPRPVVTVTAPHERRVQPLPPAGPPKETYVNVTIAPHERQIIREWIVVQTDNDNRSNPKGHKGKPLPPGLAKKIDRGGDLPPGWEKKLVKGQTLHTDIYRQCRPLPEEVIVRLPPPPPGTILVTIDRKVLRLAKATLEILDVFDAL